MRYYLNPSLLAKFKKMSEKWRIISYKYADGLEWFHVENIAVGWIPVYNNSVIDRTIMIADPSKD